MKRRTQTQTGDDSRTMMRTRVGKVSISPIPNDDDHSEWCACFRAAIIGTAAAQRSAPNPDMIVRWSVTIADRAHGECLKRRPSRKRPSE
jgi:hypothetical protein